MAWAPVLLLLTGRLAFAASPPTVTITAPSTGATFLPGQVVLFGGTATDLEDGNLTSSLSWGSDLDGNIGTGGSPSIGTLSLGTHTITASVSDSGGEIGQAQISVTVSNSPGGVPTFVSSVVTMTLTSEWLPPAPDTSDVVYMPATNTLRVVDSEVDETVAGVTLWAGANEWETTLDGTVLGTSNLTTFTFEPTGISVNPANGHLFYSDDTPRRVFEIDPGPDGQYHTPDDILTSFSTTAFGSTDPEDVTYDPNEGVIYLADGLNAEVYRIDPGPNGLFDGIAPTGDDVVTHFDTSAYAIDPECLTVNTDTNNLYIGGSIDTAIYEITTSGVLVQTIDISAAQAKHIAGIGFGPGSSDPTARRLYLVQRGTDNNTDPNENDGKLWELTLPGSGGVFNLAPVVNAGPDQTLTLPAAATLSGSVSDDGLPDPPAAVSNTWSLLSGPGSVSFADPNAASTTASFDVAGAYVLRLTASDGSRSASDDVSVTVNPVGLMTTELRITDGKDDAEERPGGAVARTSGDLELVFSTEGTTPGNQIVGLRFPGVAIPAGATIQAAYLQFQANQASSDATALTIEAQAVDNAAGFTGAAFNLSERPKTVASAAWAPPAWAHAGSAGPDERSSSLSAVVQEVVGRPGWASGNALAFFVSGTGLRVAESFEGTMILGAGAALLHVEYTSGPPQNQAPVANAGPDQMLTMPDSALVSGSWTDDGLPIPPGAVTLAWSVVSGPGSVAFEDPAAASTTASFSSPGLYTLSFTASDGAIATSDQVSVTVNPTGYGMSEARVAIGADDAEERPDGSVARTSVDLELVYSTEGVVAGDQTVGLRFLGLAIPPGAAIQNAYVQFQAEQASSDATALTIEGQVADNAPGFTTAAFDLTSRPRTAHFVSWEPPDWNNAGLAGPEQRSPDLSGVVQEVVSRPGWVSGNAIVLLVSGTGLRFAESYEGSATGAALLHVEYADGSSQNQAAVVDAGADQTITLPSSATLAGAASDDGLPSPPGAVVFSWSVFSGPGTVSFADPNAAATTASFSARGVYVLRLVANDGEFNSSDDVAITVLSENQAPIVDAGADQTISLPASTTLVGAVSDDGLPNPPGAVTVNWSVFSGPGGVSFSDPNAASTSVSFLATGVHVLRLTASDGDFASSDDVVVTVNASGFVQTEAVVAVGNDDAEERPGGAVARGSLDLELVYSTEGVTPGDQTVGVRFGAVAIPQGATIQNAYLQFQANQASSGTATLTIQGQVADNAPGFTGADFDLSSRSKTATSLVWVVPPWAAAGEAGENERTPSLAGVMQEIVSRPGWASGNAVVLLVTGTGLRVAESYESSPTGAARLHVEYVVGALQNEAPLVEAGIDQTITLGASATLSGSASDDGLPDPPGATTVAWSLVSGPGAVSFANPTALSTTAGFSAPGIYVLRLTANDSAFNSSDDVTIIVNGGPFVNAGPDQTIVLPASALLSGTVSDDGLPNPPGAVTVVWSVLSGPGSVAFADPNLVSTSASFSTAGSYVLRLSASDGGSSSVDDIAVTVRQNQAPLVAAGADQTIVLPASVSLSGAVSDDGLPDPPAALASLWSLASGPGSVVFSNPTAVSSAASFSAPGIYTLRLKASDGVLASGDDVVITVDATTEVRVATGNDDAEERAGGAVSRSSGDLELVYSTEGGTAGNQIVGLRFLGLSVPRNAIIRDAYLQFRADSASSAAPAALIVQGQAIDNAPALTKTAFNLSSRTRTTAAAAWSPAPWAHGSDTGPDQRASNLAAVIQEIVDRPGWAGGNALVLMVTGTGLRLAESYEGSAVGAALLHLQYTVGPPQNQPPVVVAGADQAITLPALATLSGSVIDDGLPNPPAAVSVAWSLVSGPGSVAFADPNAAMTTASFSAAGTYVLRLGASDGTLVANDDITVSVNPAGLVTTELRVASGSDDVEERPGGAVGRTSKDLELVYSTEGTVAGDQTVGLRFVGLPVPRGAVIYRAYLQFQTDEKTSAATALTIRAQAADSPPTFTGTAFNVTSRPTTVAATSWVPPAWSVVGEAGASQRTPSLTAVIQEVVSRQGWAQGNALVLVVTGTGRRTAVAYEGSSSGAPLLHIEVLPAGGSPGN